MYCTECGQKLPDEAKFCPNCGTVAESETQYVPVNTSHIPAAGGITGPSPVTPKPVVTQESRRLSRKQWWGILGVGIILLLMISYLYSGVTGPGREAAFQQWMKAATSFYQGYYQIENAFEMVNQNPRTTHPEATKAWQKLVSDLQGLQGRLDNLQPPPGAAGEDAADMAQIRRFWSNMLTAEIQMGQQLLQYSHQGQRPPNEFLQGTLPRLWQVKNKQFQDQQQFFVRLATRHRVSAVNPGTSNQP